MHGKGKDRLRFVQQRKGEEERGRAKQGAVRQGHGKVALGGAKVKYGDVS